MKNRFIVGILIVLIVIASSACGNGGGVSSKDQASEDALNGTYIIYDTVEYRKTDLLTDSEYNDSAITNPNMTETRFNDDLLCVMILRNYDYGMTGEFWEYRGDTLFFGESENGIDVVNGPHLLEVYDHYEEYPIEMEENAGGGVTFSVYKNGKELLPDIYTYDENVNLIKTVKYQYGDEIDEPQVINERTTKFGEHNLAQEAEDITTSKDGARDRSVKYSYEYDYIDEYGYPRRTTMESSNGQINIWENSYVFLHGEEEGMLQRRSSIYESYLNDLEVVDFRDEQVYDFTGCDEVDRETYLIYRFLLNVSGANVAGNDVNLTHALMKESEG